MSEHEEVLSPAKKRARPPLEETRPPHAWQTAQACSLGALAELHETLGLGTQTGNSQMDNIAGL